LGFRNVVLASTLVAAACGGSPAAPSGASAAAGGGLPFHAGAYEIDFLGGSLECGDIKIPPAGTSISVRFDMRAETGGWTATATSGTLTLHFRPGAGTQPTSVALAGTGNGFADDQGITLGPPLVIPPNGTRLTTDGAISLSGAMPPGFVSDFSHGTLDGPVVFSRNGVASTCPAGAVGWTLNRMP
jgi:hypothetical protein